MKIPAAGNLRLREEGGAVTVPLEHNLNDKGCLFAGSIYAGAILAGYRAAERAFARRGLSGELVAKTASVSYLGRIVTDGVAEVVACGEPAQKANGNQVLALTVAVFDSARNRCAECSAEFVLLKARADSV